MPRYVGNRKGATSSVVLEAPELRRILSALALWFSIDHPPLTWPTVVDLFWLLALSPVSWIWNSRKFKKGSDLKNGDCFILRLRFFNLGTNDIWGQTILFLVGRWWRAVLPMVGYLAASLAHTAKCLEHLHRKLWHPNCLQTLPRVS